MNFAQKTLAFFIGSLLLAMVCLIIIGWPAQLEAVADITAHAGTTPMAFALLIFVFGEFALFVALAFKR